MMTGDGKALKYQVLALAIGLVVTLLLLVLAIARQFLPPALLPEIEMPGPLPDGDVGPKGNPAEWITTDDYPPEAIRANHEGTTAFKLGIDAEGRPRVCRIASSSGHASLDRAACSAMMRRAQFDPARGADGEAIESTLTRRVVWKLPAITDGSAPKP